MDSFYHYLSDLIYDHPRYQLALNFIISITTLLIVLAYLSLVIFLFITKSTLLLEALFYPWLALTLVSLLRKAINRERPYELYSIDAIHHHREGFSFPSRHATCAWIIALIALRVNLTLGIILCLVALTISITRVLGCLHFISDVLFAFAFSGIIAYLSVLIK